jgi:hypothetical protein
MHLTIDSEKMIKCILDNNYTVFKKVNKHANITDKIYKTILNDIIHSYAYTITTILKNNITPNIYKDKTNSMNYSDFFPEEIREEINKKYIWKLKYNMEIYGKKVNIIFGITSSQFDKKLYDNKVKHIMALVAFYLRYTKTDKIKKITLYLYLTPYKKYLPKNNIDILGPNNCNTAYTYPCSQEVTVFLYRQEEWFKVLAHEIMHAFCLDFTNFKHTKIKTEMNKIFNIKSDFLLSETYSEYWGLLINCSFIAYNQMDNKDIDNYQNFKLYLNVFINFEKQFSFLQCVKILSYMNLKYKFLYKNKEINDNTSRLLYKSDTNVFTYYIIKIVFLYFYEDFLKLCYENNDNIIHFDKTDYNIKRILDFIKKNYNNKQMLKTLSVFENIVDSGINNACGTLRDTNRMTITEIFI